MRNFRKAALAGATAVAVAFGSTAVATAETTEDTTAAENTYVAPSRPVEDKDGKDGVEPASSEKITHSEWLQFRDEDGNLRGTDGRAIFGEKDNFDAQPQYAKLAYGATIFTVVSALVGLIVGPLYNFIVHGDVQF
ncbi:hypothetical protein [Corynebacterium lujinxingii]|uniref:Or membrane protein n=1 Tax=Corynebacterium lujinxingii TaxID=2763010 RepID=A0A7H0JWX7_9CORY|nr:hypothetical protein [Corynebacterium lujinxingii]MBC3178038.1 hypothetical protein [Corynebacterium lujinxingii]NNO09720.1 hypothetical protein [Corynebacterium lujinxingii]QNP89543.1 hypothetical protein IAU68_07480 [Corynebacterium lujinxingii]